MNTKQMIPAQAVVYNRKHIMKTALILSTLLFTHILLAAVSETATIEGVIIKYDKKTVTLSQNGKKIKVPRKSIPDYFKIRGGNKVYAVINTAIILKKMKVTKRKPAATKKKKVKRANKQQFKN